MNKDSCPHDLPRSVADRRLRAGLWHESRLASSLRSAVRTVRLSRASSFRARYIDFGFAGRVIGAGHAMPRQDNLRALSARHFDATQRVCPKNNAESFDLGQYWNLRDTYYCITNWGS